MLPDYRPEPLLDFSSPAQREAQEKAIQAVFSRLGGDFPLIIGGEAVSTRETFASLNPGDTGQVVGRVSRAGQEEAERALRTAEAAFTSWSRVPGPDRAAVLVKAAAIMRRRRHELNAWEMVEAGKTWAEADADVAEAIDFLEYYAREMIRLSGPVPVTPLPGEKNEYFYIPLGPGAILPPWNFPLAILTGMTSAAVVSGNTVVLKPASATPVIGAKFMEILQEAGLPEGVVNFVPGPGDVVGDYLVSHPRVRFVSFTGSMEVGLRIHELAARHQPGQKWLKRVVLEMGGKDAIIVDETADLEEAASAIVTSAYGFQGQKCSACSRVIAVDDVYDELLDRVAERAAALRIGVPWDPATQVGPVSDAAAERKILGYMDLGRQEGRLVLGGGKAQVPGHPGYYLQPTIFADVDPKARIAQEEIFGPVLAFLRAPDFTAALQMANDTVYGLTGSVFSRRRDRLIQAAQEFHVGNLYFNRKCTGAVVGVHPFGGFNLSGTDSKTGSPDHLLLFLQGKAVSEKL
ncbi:MAG: L-glutamate gamma-semialdehyde dehydrogenase [Firmicutes bacterium]|nr:L-glutamate gamma-semialdehyde dehydrogenase [Bacillota bacterium]